MWTGFIIRDGKRNLLTCDKGTGLYMRLRRLPSMSSRSCALGLQRKNMQIRLIVSKLATATDVSVNSCFALYATL